VKILKKPKNWLRQAGFWVTLLVNIAIAIILDLIKPKPELENAKPLGLGDFDFPTATEGRPVPIIWGTVKYQGPNVVWYGDLRKKAIKEKVKTGIFSSEKVIVGYKYKVGLQMALCRGPLDSIRKIWIGDDIVFNGTLTDGGTYLIDRPELYDEDDGIRANVKFKNGNDSQTLHSYLTTFQKEGGDSPGYKGIAYVCPNGHPWYLGNSPNIKKWSFEMRRIPNGLGLSTAESELNGGNDANPMNVIYEILTNADWGRGVPVGEIDTASFITAAQTLATENNGFSFVLDRISEQEEVLNLLYEQIDGLVFFDPATAKWKAVLARDDYTVGALDPIDDTNSRTTSFSRGSWSETTNIVKLKFNDRTDEYKETYAQAIDPANIRIQNDTNIIAEKRYPAVKDRTLANALCWRDLRALSFPLAKCKVYVDRSFWDVTPAKMFRYSSTTLGITDLPMRVQKINFGKIDDNKIEIDLIQDVFYSMTPSSGDPTSTGGGDPLTAPADITDRIVEEAPWAITWRQFETGQDRNVMVFARDEQDYSGYQLWLRYGAVPPTGNYAKDVTAQAMVYVGQLTSNLTRSAYPVSTIAITSNPDDQDDLLDVVGSFTTTTNGVNLYNLFYCEGELMLAEYATDNGANVDLKNVYRGVLDTAQVDHSAGADVYFLSVDQCITLSGLSDIGDNWYLDAKILPFNGEDVLAEGDATAESIQFDRRVRRPYPPSQILINNTLWKGTSTSWEGNGAGPEDYHIEVDWHLRDYRTAEGGNEIVALETAASTLFSDFPSANTTETKVTLTDDPDGTPTVIYNAVVVTSGGETKNLNRIDVLRVLDGAVPDADQEVSLTARHTDAAVVLDARTATTFKFTTTTALSGQFGFKTLSKDEISAVYTADAAGQHDFTLSSSFTAGDVEYRLNGGAWTTLISAGGTTGNIAGVAVSDTIEIVHRSTDGSILKQIDMAAPGAGTDAFGIFE
jgi:hypothetical protein